MANYSLIKTPVNINGKRAYAADKVVHTSDHLGRPQKIHLGTANEDELKMCFHRFPNLRVFIAGEVDPKYQWPNVPSETVSKPEIKK